jgi:hypothetical protein
MKRITAAHFTVLDLLRQTQLCVPAYRCRIQNANLARSKVRPVLRIIDRLIFLRVSEIPSNLPTILPNFLNNHRLASVRIVVGARESEHILAKSMKDSVVRGCLLQLLYERRSEGSIPFGRAEQAAQPPGGISRRDWLRAVAQLSEYRLIDWTPLEDKSGMGQLSGFAKINDFGVKVLEAGVAPPIRISIDESRRPTVSRQEQGSIATSTPQQQAITQALEKVITAINQADLSEKEKNAAKSSLRKLLGSKAAAKVLGAGAQSLVAKHFEG